MPASAPRRVTKGFLAYTRLKEKIQSGEVSAEEPVTEASVSLLLDVGRGPAREAILRLVAEGLIRSRGPHKTRYIEYVEDLDPVRLTHQFEVREMLDGLAARGAALHLTGAQINSLREHYRAIEAGCRDGERIARGEATRAVFELIRAGCGNPLVATALDACEILPIFARDDETDAGVWADKEAGEMRVKMLGAAIEAIAAHDPDAAEATMRAVIRENARVLTAWVGQRAAEKKSAR